MDLLLLTAGVLALAAGGEALVRGALGASRRLGVAPALSGLVIVGFGTSMPELTVSLDAALAGRADIAVGNVVGSNIANVLLILGICAVVAPLTVSPRALRRDALMVVVVSLGFVALSLGGALGRLDGAALLAMLVAYVAWAYRHERLRDTPAAAVHGAEASELVALPGRAGWIALALLGGLALLIGGARLMVAGAVGLGVRLGIPEAVVGLTVVAVGTSLPELAVSLIASIRRHADVAVANVLGSNIFNVAGILGFTAALQPLQVGRRVLVPDRWVMLAVAVALLAVLASGLRIGRTEGGVLLAGYAAYVGFTVVAG